MGQYFKSKVTQTKVTQKKNILALSSVWSLKNENFDKHDFFCSFRLADDQKPFNAISKNSNPPPPNLKIF